MSTLRLIEDSQNEPVSLDDAKLFLAIDEQDDSYDDLVIALEKAARKFCEKAIGQAFITQTWELWLDSFTRNQYFKEPWWDGVRQGAMCELFGQAGTLTLPVSPVQSVVNITTYSLDNTASLFDLTHLLQTQNSISLNYGQAWPVNLRSTHGVKIQFIAGYGDDPEDVPDDLIHAVKLMTAHLFEHREAAVETALSKAQLSVMAILDSYKVKRI